MEERLQRPDTSTQHRDQKETEQGGLPVLNLINYEERANFSCGARSAGSDVKIARPPSFWLATGCRPSIVQLDRGCREASAALDATSLGCKKGIRSKPR